MSNNIPLRWFWVGALNYFITCLQCAFQVTLTFQQVIHFTDWVVAHAHLVMFGVFSFWIFGMIEHLWPKLVGREWWSESLRSWHFWLTTLGLTGMFLGLTGGGITEGFMAMNLAPRESILQMLQPFWLSRMVTGSAILIGFACMAVNMAMTALKGSERHIDADYAPFEQDEEVSVGAI